MKSHATRRWLFCAAIALFTFFSSNLSAQGLLYFVNTTSDTIVIGACENGNPGCSLRGAISATNNHPGEDGIEIDLPAGSVINLTGPLPDISESVGIVGPGANLVTVQRNTGGDYRIFNVTTTGTVAFSGMTISNGRAVAGGGGFGGGIQNASSGTVNVSNCTVSGNFASGTGGGIDQGSGTVNVTNSTISENSAQDGGGIGNGAFGTLTVTNCTLSGNLASGTEAGGGGIFNNGILTLTNCTLSDNSAGFAGAIFNSGTTNIKSCIIARNTAPGAPDLVNENTIVSQGFNLIGKNDGAAAVFPAGNPNANNDIVGTSASPVDPKLDPNGLQDNGGPTQTIVLLSDSPAIDKGTSIGSTGSLTTDQRGPGFPRTFDYTSITNAAGGNGTDIGAFELLVPFSVSRKVHGATNFDIDLPLTGAAGIECRTGGVNNDHQVIVTFPSPVTVTSVSVTSGTGSVSSFTVSAAQVTVNLTGVSNAQTIVLTLFGVSDGTNSSNVNIPMGVLLGDTTGDGSVNSGDIAQTKSQSGQAVDGTNFRTDVTVDGSLNSGDIALVKSKSGTALP